MSLHSAAGHRPVLADPLASAGDVPAALPASRWLFRTGPRSAADSIVKALVFVAWFCLVSFMAMHHDFWRDEVRALSMAINPPSTVDMLRAVHGEGHPALWYLMLRFGYVLTHAKQVLPVMAIAVAAVSTAVLAIWSPFRWPLFALIVVSKFSLFEFSVMARNYGISMLLMYLLALAFSRRHARGWIIGGLLLLLANTNVHSVVLVLGFLLFWLVNALLAPVAERRKEIGPFIVACVFSLVGTVLCFLTVYPPFNDAAAAVRPAGIDVTDLLNAVFNPGGSFLDLTLLSKLDDMGIVVSDPEPLQWLMSVVLFGSLLGLVRFPAALLASVVSLVGLSAFFAIVFPGGYRHQALWLVFLLVMYWLAYSGSAVPVRTSPRVAGVMRGLTGAGMVLLVVVMLLQIPPSVNAVQDAVLSRAPLSQTGNFGRFLKTRPDLKDAILLGDPDFLVEPVTYYVDNRSYLPREQRFGAYVKFTRRAKLRLTLDDLLATGQRLRADSGKPVVILLGKELGGVMRPVIDNEAYDWQFYADPAQVRHFVASTQKIGSFRPAKSNEAFDAYLVTP